MDKGHYIETPLPQGEGVLTLAEGITETRTLILRKKGESLPFSHVVLREGSKLNLCFIALPGSEAQVALSIDFVGEGAELKLTGAYICGGTDKVSVRTEVRHRVGGCVSEQIINGLAGGTSQASFYGQIVVAPDAQKTSADQTNRNIVLSTEARVNTKPQLEIYADDVKCSHGATVGALDENELFYMRSRGVPMEEAKLMQMLSFIAPVLSCFSGKEREEIEAELSQAIISVL